jgi:hypothetical protein
VMPRLLGFFASDHCTIPMLEALYILIFLHASGAGCHIPLLIVAVECSPNALFCPVSMFAAVPHHHENVFPYNSKLLPKTGKLFTNFKFQMFEHARDTAIVFFSEHILAKTAL